MNRGSKRLLVLLLVAMIVTGLTRQMVYSQRQQIQLERRRTSAGLQGLDTFALGLILGGLRGPLVMFLWTSIESQKTEKNLENIDTKIELVRMLQPEFASVHIFQIWNKAYNLSVQVASLQNKYSMILSALQYAKSVDAEQRDNVNILDSTAQTYFQKLGSSQEKGYYIMRVRQDSMPRKVVASKRQDIVWQLTHHDVLLDEKGMLLPGLLASRADAPKPRAGSQFQYNGADLQFLEPFSTAEVGGFPYGVSPLALGYNYYKRAAAIQSITGQKHLYVSDGVVDSRPGIVLRVWADEEMERARRQENAVLGKPSPEDRWEIESLTANLPPSSKFVASDEKTRKAVAEALFSYQRSQRVAEMSATEFRQHMRRDFGENPNTYLYHTDTADGVAAMAAADHAYFRAMAAANGMEQASPPATTVLIELYEKALEQFYYAMLRHDVEDAIAAAAYGKVAQARDGRLLNKATIRDVDRKLYGRIYQATVDEYKRQNRLAALEEATREYSGYITRITSRLETLKR
jgi:hypothetical protein